MIRLPMAYSNPFIILNRSQRLHLHYTHHRCRCLLPKSILLIHFLRTVSDGFFFCFLNMNACSVFSCNVSVSMRIVLFWVMTQQVAVISYHCLLHRNPILSYFVAEPRSTPFRQHAYSKPSFLISVTWGWFAVFCRVWRCPVVAQSKGTLCKLVAS